MKEISHYSDEFKQTVVAEVLSGQINKDEARRQYGIKGKSAVLNWLRKFDTSLTYEMKKKSNDTLKILHSWKQKTNAYARSLN